MLAFLNRINKPAIKAAAVVPLAVAVLWAGSLVDHINVFNLFAFKLYAFSPRPSVTDDAPKNILASFGIMFFNKPDLNPVPGKCQTTVVTGNFIGINIGDPIVDIGSTAVVRTTECK